MADEEALVSDDAKSAISLLAETQGIHAKYRIISDNTELVALTFAMSMALQPTDLTAAMIAQFNLLVDPNVVDGSTDVGACTVSVTSEFTHNVSSFAVKEAKVKDRSAAFTFVLDEDTLDPKLPPPPICYYTQCSKPILSLEGIRCGRCHGSMYCSEDCRAADWAISHSRLCALQALARTACNPEDAPAGAEGTPSLPAPEVVPLSDMPTVGSRLKLFQESALSVTHDLATFAMLQTGRFSSRVALFVEVQEYDPAPLLFAMEANEAAISIAKEEEKAIAIAAAGGALVKGDDGEEADEEAEELPSVVVRRMYVTAVPVYQLLLVDSAASAGLAAFAPGGAIRKIVGNDPIVPGVRDARAGREGASLALPRSLHTESISRAQLGTMLRACMGGSVPHGRFPATAQGRVAAFQAGDTIPVCFRDLDTGFMATAILQADVPSQHFEAAARACRRVDEASFHALMQADVLYVEQLANAPGRPTQSVNVTATWRTEKLA